VKVIWTETAAAQLAAIEAYIAQTSPFYSHLVVQRIIRHSGQIADFPNSGRTVPERNRPDIREVHEPPYRIIYQVGIDVRVLAVVHMRRANPGPLP
jgi:plasmid stabilization system protein ParE